MVRMKLIVSALVAGIILSACRSPGAKGSSSAPADVRPATKRLRVVDSDGNPIRDARVKLIVTQVLTADEQGEVRLSIPSGPTASYVVRAPGFQTQDVWDTRVHDNAELPTVSMKPHIPVRLLLDYGRSVPEGVSAKLIFFPRRNPADPDRELLHRPLAVDFDLSDSRVDLEAQTTGDHTVQLLLGSEDVICVKPVRVEDTRNRLELRVQFASDQVADALRKLTE